MGEKAAKKKKETGEDEDNTYELQQIFSGMNKNQPAKHNQAMMEFGALQCLPKKPQCPSCPVVFDCVSHNKGLVSERPQKIKKIKKKNRYLLYTVFFDRKNKMVYLKKRIEKDIWFNLYDFHLAEYASVEEFEENLSAKNVFRKKHLLTHQTLHVAFSLEEAPKNKKDLTNLKPYSMPEAKDLPMPILHEKYLLEHCGFLD